jgi:drug/metabolite transporter (DMT)-like permease
MTHVLTANQLKGRAIGALFFTGFGTLWLMLGLYLCERLSIGAVFGVLLVATGLTAAALNLMSHARRFPRVTEDARRKRMFYWIDGGQYVAIFLVLTTLNKRHLEVYDVTAIAAIVAVHLFPLAWVFQNKMHYATGGTLLLWLTGTVFFVPAQQLQGMTALGTGVILWLAAAITLVRHSLTARHASLLARTVMRLPES